MKSKSIFRMQIKTIAPDGTFEGALAVYNNVDLGGDLIEPGAFTKTIQDRGSQVPLLWQHRSDTPIGMLTLSDSPASLNVKGQLLMEIPAAKNAYLLIKSRIVKGLSIGFDTVKESVTDNVRRLKEIRLWEGSIVTFPMNEAAQITSVKAWQARRLEHKDDFNTEYAEIQLQDSMYQMYIALRYSLMAIPFTDMTRDEKIAASQESIDQFGAAYMEFIPAFVDWLDKEYGDMTFTTYGKEPGERKSGKTISAATKQNVISAANHCKSANDILIALCDEEADSDVPDADTSEGKAADIPTVPEPAKIDHSAAQSLIESIRALIPAA